jgi:hypothetical protein
LVISSSNVHNVALSTLDGFCGKKVAHNERWASLVSDIFQKKGFGGLHIVVVAPNGEREATLDFILGGGARNFQRTARKHRFLRVVESDSPELFPIADKLVLDDDLVNGELALETRQ